MDPFNLLLLAIALIVFWRLRSVLGSRTGHERPPFDPFGARGADKSPAAEPANGNVLRFPKEADAIELEAKPVEEAAAAPPWTGFAAEGSGVALGIERLCQADPTFSPRAFLDGSKIAYEMILEAFAKGDKSSLKNLLSRDVFDSFDKAIAAREQAGQRLEFRFVGIEQADLAAVALVGKRATVTVKFLSQQISATYDKDGHVVEGDPKQVQDSTDVWTFEREVNSRDPNWKLAATEEAG